MNPPAMEQIIDNRADSRFELRLPGGTVFADYRRDADRLIIRHVEAPVALRGTGAAGTLMRGMLDMARAEGAQVVPLCGYAAAWIRRHRDYADLLA